MQVTELGEMCLAALATISSGMIQNSFRCSGIASRGRSVPLSELHSELKEILQKGMLAADETTAAAAVAVAAAKADAEDHSALRRRKTLTYFAYPLGETICRA